jgi:hypothetical protein
MLIGKGDRSLPGRVPLPTSPKQGKSIPVAALESFYHGLALAASPAQVGEGVSATIIATDKNYIPIH